MYFAAAGPWVASLPRMRWKVFQPFSDSAGLVAEAVMMLRPALSKIGSAALDSPEKAGPTMPTSFLSVTAFWARPGAIDGSPWLSNEVSETLQSAFFALYSVDGELGAVLDVDAEVGGVAGEGAEEADLEVTRLVARGGVTVAGGPTTGRQSEGSGHEWRANLEHGTQDSS